MKWILIVLLVVATTSINAQILINGSELNKLATGTYIMVETHIISGSRVKGAIDYGQPFKTGVGAFMPIVNEEGRTFKFNSIIHLFNTLDKAGWLYVNSDGLYQNNNNSKVTHYLFRRKKER